MEQSNPWAGLLNRVLQTATDIVPGVIGRRDQTSTQLTDVSGTAAPAANAPADMTKWIAWVIGGVGLIALVVVLGLFARKA